MNNRTFFSLLLLAGVCLLFFYKTVLFGQLPFPGDLLANENPFKSVSLGGYTPGGYPTKGQGRDVIREILPWKKFTISEMKSGRIPFWNPHNFSGSIQMQNFQSAIFYPLNSLFFILPFPVAWSLFIFSQPLLASWFMFFFLRKIQRSYTASLIGSIAFAFSSYMIVWMEYGNIAATILWLPLMLFFLEKFVEKKTIHSAIWFIIVSTISLFAGYVQGYFYLIVFCFVYGIFLLTHDKKFTFKNIFFLLPLFMLPIGLGAIQLFSTVEVFNESTRVPYTLSQIQFLLNPWYLLPTLVAPDFFGNPATQTTFLSLTYIERVMYPGVIVFLLAFISFFSRQKGRALFFAGVACIVLIVSLRLPLVDRIYQLPIPMLSTGVPTRALSVFLFCIAVLSAYGLDIWITSKNVLKKPLIVLFLLFLVLWATTVFGNHFGLDHLSVMRKALVIPSALFLSGICALLVLQKWPYFARTLLICLVIGDLLFFFQKITPFAPPHLLYPQTPVISYIQHHAGLYRTWGYGNGYIPPNLETYIGIYGPEGEDPLHLKRYGDVIASSQIGELPVQVPRPDANIAPGYGTDDLKQNVFRKRFLDITGVKYILDRNSDERIDRDTFPQDQYDFVWRDANWQVFANKDVLPRTFVTSEAIVISNEKNAIHVIYNTLNPRQIVLQKSIPALDLQATGEASITTYTPQNIIIHTQTTGRMLLFLSDTYYGAWNAYVDGHKTPIYQADVAFRGVVVSSGQHTVSFIYHPVYFQKGLLIFIVSCFICIAYLYALKKYAKNA